MSCLPLLAVQRNARSESGMDEELNPVTWPALLIPYGLMPLPPRSIQPLPPAQMNPGEPTTVPLSLTPYASPVVAPTKLLMSVGTQVCAAA